MDEYDDRDQESSEEYSDETVPERWKALEENARRVYELDRD